MSLQLNQHLSWLGCYTRSPPIPWSNLVASHSSKVKLTTSLKLIPPPLCNGKKVGKCTPGSVAKGLVELRSTLVGFLWGIGQDSLMPRMPWHNEKGCPYRTLDQSQVVADLSDGNVMELPSVKEMGVLATINPLDPLVPVEKRNGPLSQQRIPLPTGGGVEVS
ncbi:hypothetical protein NE237_009697 [Protea cynaroides]|uniref:Uncharacterized protein n=1 Tax=Protea cynaroides TaxID=273540 RepID=A0A9Q0KYA2_9MAGN|nr:hypothetical protein NE237_009697 [Protea cynaroides]